MGKTYGEDLGLMKRGDHFIADDLVVVVAEV